MAYKMPTHKYTSVSTPKLGPQSDNQKRVGPTIAPTGGHFSGLSNIEITTPSRAFINNNQMAQSRAVGTIPENAMTPDIHSDYWSM